MADEKKRDPGSEQVFVSEPMPWFDGMGHGPWVVKMEVRASWIGYGSVSFAPTNERDPDLPAADERVYGGPCMSSADARAFAAALVKAADLADAKMAAGGWKP